MQNPGGNPDLLGKPRRKLLWLAAAGYAVLLSISGWMIQWTLAAELAMHGGQANRQFTRMFANDHWEQLRPLLKLGATAEEAKDNPHLDEITSIVRRFAAGTELVAVKIFNAQGLVLYAPDPKQIGSDKSRSEGFLKAIRGLPATELIHRDVISGFDGEVHDSDLVSSYVPVRRNATVEAVVEVYSDRTHAISMMAPVSARLVATVAVLAALSLIPWFVLTRMLTRELKQSRETSQSLTHQLAAKIDDCTRGSRETTHFLALIADQLEGPAQQALEALRQTPADDASVRTVQARLESIARRAVQLRRLSQIEFGQISGKSSRFEAGDLIHRIGTEALARAELAGARTLLHVTASVGGACEGDPALIAEAVEILAQLTIRRLKEGDTVQLRCQTEARGVTIDMIDSGRTLSARQVALLRGEPRDAVANVESADGTAIEPDDEIGMRLVAGLVRAMQGRVSAHSSPEHGTSVSLWLPLLPTGSTPFVDDSGKSATAKDLQA